MEYKNQNYQRPRNQNFNKDNRNWKNDFDIKWITNGITKEAVKFCDEFGIFLYENRLSSSQIRNVYGELKRIQMKGFENEKTSFILLKPKMAYAVVRDGKKGLKALGQVFDKAFDVVNSENEFTNLMDFMEAVLAYHKAHGGK
jgi:CRISPR-associated protein Csm2